MVTTRSQTSKVPTSSNNITKNNKDDENNTEPARTLYAECAKQLEEIKKEFASEEQEEPSQPSESETISEEEITPQTSKHDKKDDSSNDEKDQRWVAPKSLIAFFVLIIAILCGAWYKGVLPEQLNDFLNTSLTPSKSSHDKIIANLNELLNTPKFNENVPVIGLTIMRNAFKNALSGSVKAPVIVLLMATSEQSDLVRNISHQLANLIAAGKENSLTATSIQINSKHSQSDIENFYHTTFQQQGKSILLLENLEELDPKNAMVLHQFSDGENSVIPSTFTIVTLKYKQQVTVDLNASLKQLAEISTNELQSLWKPFWSNDNLDCVINRIAENTVVLLNK